jgi:3-oxoacyl-[acyl-carrier-protein] synthase-3
VVTNQNLEKIVDTSDEWIFENLGIRERRITNKSSSYLGTLAGLRAIHDAGLKPLDIDLIIVATSTPDRLNPSTACMIQDNLGCYNAAAFDLNAVCSGFVYALQVAHDMKSDYSLVIGVDTFSHITDWSRRDCVFFGDGAGAVVLKNDDKLWHSVLGANGTGRDAFTTRHGGTFEMDGKAVYKEGTTELPKMINDLMNEYWITPDQIKHVIPHQPSIKMLRKLAEEIDIPFSRFYTNMDKYGNTAAASIPILLDEVKNKFKPGEMVMLAAIGSGWTYGAIILEW